jgi:predicted dehydrogenase
MALSTLRGVRITAVTDIVPAAAEALAKKVGATVAPSHQDLLARPDVDAVVIAVPDDAHLVPTLDAIAAGKHILLEKPLAMSLEDGKRILQAAQAAPRQVFLVGHILRFDPRFAGAAKAVRSGEIGDIVHIAIRRNSAVLGPRRYGTHVSLPYHVSVHDADLLRFVSGLEVEQVYAQATTRVLKDIGHYDTLLAVLNLNGGAICGMEACWVLPPCYRSALDGFLEVVGTKGVIYVETMRQGLTVVDETGPSYPDTMRYYEWDGRAGGLVRAEAEHFLECIDRGRTPLVTVSDGYQAIRISQALQDSINAGRPVPLPG